MTAGLFPDGNTVWFAGYEPGHSPRYFRTDFNGSKPVPVTPEGARPVSPNLCLNGKFFALKRGERIDHHGAADCAILGIQAFERLLSIIDHLIRRPKIHGETCTQGGDLAVQLRDLTLAIYSRAAEYAKTRGIVIADTKFEFGLVDGVVTLVDEVLTPDSSRFWPADTYEPGHGQPSFDKQYVRDWLEASGWDKTPPAPKLPADVVAKTSEKYVQAYELITGRAFVPERG